MKCRKNWEITLRKVLILVTMLAVINITPVLSQNQRITLKLKNSSISEVFKKIKSETNLSVAYNVEDISSDKRITYEAKDKPLSEVLDYVLNEVGQNLSYVIQDDHIVINSSATKVTSAKTVQQSQNITGVVVDSEGEPVIGATVVLKGNASVGTATDFDGNFILSNVPNNAILLVSYVGMSSQEITVVQGKTVYNVTLADDSELLDDLVVTALGIKRSEKALSYNVQQVKAEELTRVKDTNFMNSLAGKVAGVQINSGATGSGGAARVVMRGMKSISKDNNALYVIDGVPMFNTGSSGGEGQYGDMGGSDAVADINPEDIESLSMMTGASAAALYGSSAANGVVLISTKRGKKERLSINFSNSTTFSSAYMMPKMQNKYGTSSGILSWGDLTDRRYNAKDFFNTGTNIINSISLSTGTDRNQTYVSASTTNSNDILPNSDYNRYNFTARNTTSFLDDKLTLDFGAQYISQDNTNMVSQGQYYNPLPAVYLFPRGDDFDEIRLYERYNTSYGFMEQYWPYGDAGLSLQNPYWVQNRILRETNKKRYILNASLRWQATSWLDIIGRVNIDNSDYKEKTSKHATTLKTFSDINGGLEQRDVIERSLYADALGTINKDFGDFNLNANLGASIYHPSLHSTYVAGNLKKPNYFQLNNLDFATSFKMDPRGFDEEVQSVFANVEYSYNNQIYLTLTGRNDWDSKLAMSSQKSFFYPSIGTSAILSEIINLPKVISFAKIRGSYTEVGSSFDRYMTNPGFEWNAQTQNWENPTIYPMYNMKAERTKSWEAGLNLTLFNNKLKLDATYYNSNTLNQTFLVDIPSSSGYSKAVVQAGKVQNSGVELALGYSNSWRGFGWSSNVTLTMNQNKVKKLADGEINKVTGERIDMKELPIGWLGNANVAPRVILREGGTMTDIYVYNQLTKDNNGNIKVDPQTGNLSITSSSTPTKVGDLNAKYQLGWANNFTYKGINLGVVLTGRVGGKAYSATQGILDYYGTSLVTADARDNGGLEINNGMVEAQKYYQAVATGEGGYGRYYLYNATNFRLQELSLNYTLPKKWTNDTLGITLGLIGRNLFMIYCKAPFDPELSASTSSNFYMNVDYFMQPSTRNIGFNVKLNF